MYLLEKVCLAELDAREALARDLAALPHSPGRDHEAALILEDLRSGHGTAHWIRRDGKHIGMMVTSKTGDFFEVLAMRLTQAEHIFQDLVPNVVEPMAIANGCRHLEFATVRPGFIRAAKAGGYEVSRVYIRKALA